MRQTSAIPIHYYAIFAIYEPFLTSLGFIGALLCVPFFLSDVNTANASQRSQGRMYPSPLA